MAHPGEVPTRTSRKAAVLKGKVGTAADKVLHVGSEASSLHRAASIPERGLGLVLALARGEHRCRLNGLPRGSIGDVAWQAVNPHSNHKGKRSRPGLQGRMGLPRCMLRRLGRPTYSTAAYVLSMMLLIVLELEI